MNRRVRASDQEEPWKMAIEVAGDAAEDDSNATKSHWSDHAESSKGKENATPGYDRT